MPTMMRKPKKTGQTGGRSARGHSFRPLHLAVPGMGQDQAAQMRNLDRGVQLLGIIVGDAEQGQCVRRLGVVQALDGGELGRLIPRVLRPCRSPSTNLQRHQHDQQVQRHLDHQLAFLGRSLAADQIGADAEHDEAGGDVEGGHVVGEPVWERRVEHDRRPVGREEPLVDNRVAGRRLHPAVGGQDPERRQQRAERDHHRRQEMRPARHQRAPEQQHAEERRLQEECHQAFIGQHRRNHVRRDVGEARPVGAELERHDDPGHHAHAERNREDPGPEPGDAEPDLLAGEEVQALQHGNEGCQSDGEGGQQDMPGDRPRPIAGERGTAGQDAWPIPPRSTDPR